MSRKITHEAQAFPQGLFVAQSNQQANLGIKAVSDNGEVFRLVKAGASALVAGTLQQAPAIVANHQDVAVAVAASIGAEEVTVTLGATAATLDQYAGGLLVVNDADGQGFSYRIDANPAADASGALLVKLDDKLEEALTTSSQVCLIPNIYNGVIINPATPSNVPVGVAIKDIPAGEFGWIQTRGPVSCLNDSGTAVGLGLAPSDAVAGALETVAATTNQVASALQAGVDTESRAVFLQID